MKRSIEQKYVLYSQEATVRRAMQDERQPQSFKGKSEQTPFSLRGEPNLTPGTMTVTSHPKLCPKQWQNIYQVKKYIRNNRESTR